MAINYRDATTTSVNSCYLFFNLFICFIFNSFLLDFVLKHEFNKWILQTFILENRDATNVCFVEMNNQEDCNFVVPPDDRCDRLSIRASDNTADIDVMLNKGCAERGSKSRLLDDAPPSCNVPCFKITKRGKYCYISTRNSNFSNREHRGEITVIGNWKRGFLELSLIVSITFFFKVSLVLSVCFIVFLYFILSWA